MIESNCNPNLPSWKVLSLLNSEWDMKFYFIYMKFDEVGIAPKHPRTINGNVKNLRRRMEKKNKGKCRLLLWEFKISSNYQHSGQTQSKLPNFNEEMDHMDLGMPQKHKLIFPYTFSNRKTCFKALLCVLHFRLFMYMVNPSSMFPTTLQFSSPNAYF